MGKYTQQLAVYVHCSQNDLMHSPLRMVCWPISMPMYQLQENIARNQTPEDWRCREAATFAFGSILEGPSLDQLAKLSSSGFEFLVNAMKDSNSQVRHTTAWTIGAPTIEARIG